MGAGNGTTGWQNAPNQRGTFDILKTCIGTIILLCFTSVCPNVPSPTGGYWSKFRMKLSIFLLAVISPDFVFALALGELEAAFTSRAALRKAGLTWNLQQCFFVNMGGLHLQFRDRKRQGKPSFAVNCIQLLKLKESGILQQMPSLTTKDVEDRNKQDRVARSLAVIQSLFFTADALGRVCEGLFLTTLELTTLGFVYLMTICSICWWKKPMDVSQPIVMELDCDLSYVQERLHAPDHIHGRTPP